MNTGKVNKNIELSAIVYPNCICGNPWSEHGACGGYKPSSVIQDHGTVAFRSNDKLAMFLFYVERFFKNLRIARLRSL